MQDFLDTDSPSAGPPKTGLSETIRDFEYFSMLCPGKLRGIQAEVKAVCDRLEALFTTNIRIAWLWNS